MPQKTHFKKKLFKDDKKLRVCFSAEQLNLMASTAELIKRDRKFTLWALISVMVFGKDKSYQVSLTEKCQHLFDLGIIITKQGLDKRLNNKAALFLKGVLENLLNLKLVNNLPNQILKNFKGIFVIDATSFQLPDNLATTYKGSGGGSTNSGIKTHYMVDISSKGDTGLEFTHTASSDTTTQLIKPKKGFLYLFDLGYVTFKRLLNIQSESAFYLCRMSFNPIVWIKSEKGYEQLKWAEQIKKMREGQIKELSVFLGKEKNVESRLVIEKVPQKIADEKRRKLKTDKVNKRKSISKERLAYCDLNAYITNATAKQLSSTDARAVYGLRWQIEIYFKTWKSYMNIDKIRNMNIDRFNCTHYGTLIYIILTSKIFFYLKYTHWNKKGVELSELKAMKYFSDRKLELEELLFGSAKRANLLWEATIANITFNCIKERKYNQLTPYEVIQSCLS